MMLALVLVLAAGSPDGFQNLTWGMTFKEAKAVAKVSSALRADGPHRAFGFFTVAGDDMAHAELLFTKEGKLGVVRVHLTGEPLHSVVGLLTEKYGEPKILSKHTPLENAYEWVGPTTVIRCYRLVGTAIEYSSTDLGDAALEIEAASLQRKIDDERSRKLKGL